jgi:catechol 2,3-dioxygenase-like lactoylglutathione lyase family enzyme
VHQLACCRFSPSIRNLLLNGMHSILFALEVDMRMVPVIKSSNLERSVCFYTEVLDFQRMWPEEADRETANGVAHLTKDGAELLLSRHAGDGVFGSVSRVFVDDVDERYRTFVSRGLDTARRPESPIHTAPVDQTWGLREFAVTDPDGNGLCFCAPIKQRIGTEE